MVACVLIGVCCNIWKIYFQIDFLANYFYMWMKRCWANFQRVGQLVRDGWIGIACFQPPSFLWWFLKLMLGEGGSGCWALTDWKESCSGMRWALHNAKCSCNCIMQSTTALQLHNAMCNCALYNAKCNCKCIALHNALCIALHDAKHSSDCTEMHWVSLQLQNAN